MHKVLAAACRLAHGCTAHTMDGLSSYDEWTIAALTQIFLRGLVLTLCLIKPMESNAQDQTHRITTTEYKKSSHIKQFSFAYHHSHGSASFVGGVVP